MERLKFKEADCIATLPHEPRGRPTLLGAHEEDLLQWITKIRKSGGIINGAIVKSSIMGIVRHQDKGLLAENGGPLEVTRTLVYSIMRQFGLVKRKRNKGCQKIAQIFR